MRHHGWFYWVCLIGFIVWTAYRLPGAFLYIIGVAAVSVAILLIFDIKDPNGYSLRDYLKPGKRELVIDKKTRAQMEKECEDAEWQDFFDFISATEDD